MNFKCFIFGTVCFICVSQAKSETYSTCITTSGSLYSAYTSAKSAYSGSITCDSSWLSNYSDVLASVPSEVCACLASNTAYTSCSGIKHACCVTSDAEVTTSGSVTVTKRCSWQGGAYIYTYYSCASGYYGTASASENNCVACPSNATCSGGTTFRCKANYYKTDDSCTLCTAVPDGVFIDSALTQVPSVSNGRITSPAGATSENQCFLVAGTYYDVSGEFVHDGFYYDCQQDETCSIVQGVCSPVAPMGTSNTFVVYSGFTAPGESSSVSSGYCYCKQNGKYFLYGFHGACSSTCNDFCVSAIENNTNSILDKLGC